MSLIVEKTFPYLDKLIQENEELVLQLLQSHPKATDSALQSEIGRVIKYQEYEQGDIELWKIQILGENKSVPIIEYTFGVKNSNFGIKELDKLLKKYSKNLVKDEIPIYIPVNKEKNFLGGIRIYIGTNMMCMGAHANFKNLLSVAKEMESIVQDIYGKNIKNEENDSRYAQNSQIAK